MNLCWRNWPVAWQCFLFILVTCPVPVFQESAVPADDLLDTTRAAYQLMANGCVRCHPELRIILSHTGGFVPYANHRMAIAIAGELGPTLDAVLDDFRSF